MAGFEWTAKGCLHSRYAHCTHQSDSYTHINDQCHTSSSSSSPLHYYCKTDMSEIKESRVWWHHVNGVNESLTQLCECLARFISSFCSFSPRPPGLPNFCTVLRVCSSSSAGKSGSRARRYRCSVCSRGGTGCGCTEWTRLSPAWVTTTAAHFHCLIRLITEIHFKSSTQRRQPFISTFCFINTNSFNSAQMWWWIKTVDVSTHAQYRHRKFL